ncbi:MAG: PKD domain-containing protein [Planctomycetes bacterium]|nr:PKD domain-containing protein [Planctomycetota bacterium]
MVGTQLYYDNSAAGGSHVATAILLQAGGVYGVLGACNDAQGGGSAFNSYGTPAGPFTSSILGNPVVLTRLGTQSNIAANGGNQPVWQEVAGPVSRVEIDIVPAVGAFANFTSDRTTGATPLVVNFQDASFTSAPGGIVSWAWDFENDGTIDSSIQNPTHVYTTCGNYDVALTVADGINPPASILEAGHVRISCIGNTEVAPAGTIAAAAGDYPGPAWGASLANFDVQATTGDNGLLGCVLVDDRWYVSGANTGGSHMLYELDRTSGSLIAAYPQPTSTNDPWGMRDLATDGRYVFGGDESRRIQVFDTATSSFLAPIDVSSVAGPGTTVRALAYFESLPGGGVEGFAFQDWEGTTSLVDMSGSYVGSFPSPVGRVSGFTSLPWGSELVYVSQNDPGATGTDVLLTVVDPATGQVLQQMQFYGDDVVGGIAGGVEIAWDLLNGSIFATAMHQAGSDTIVSYELGRMATHGITGTSCGSTPPDIVSHGGPEFGSTGFGYSLLGAQPGSLAACVIGLGGPLPGGGIPIPGMPAGCRLQVSQHAVALSAVDAGGRTTTPVSIPSTIGLLDVPLSAQYAVLSPSGLQASVMTKVSFGKIGGIVRKAATLQHGACAIQVLTAYAFCKSTTSTAAQYKTCVCNGIDGLPLCTKLQKKLYRKANGC